MEIFCTVTVKKKLSPQEAVFLQTLVELGKESTAKSVLDKAGGALVSSELYALSKRLVKKGLIVRSTLEAKIMDETVSRITFTATEVGIHAFEEAKKKAGK